MKPANIAQHSAIQKVSRFLHLDIPEVWVRFLLAIVGLVLAFGAALFSTVSRESGNLWTTVFLASVALVLAVVVGLTTVPYLARRVAGAGIRDAFDFDVTKVGIVYVAIVLLIGIAALNTGNNLLYIVVAAMLAAIWSQGLPRRWYCAIWSWTCAFPNMYLQADRFWANRVAQSGSLAAVIFRERSCGRER